jgi:S1-C subfamily serine protease
MVGSLSPAAGFSCPGCGVKLVFKAGGLSLAGDDRQVRLPSVHPATRPVSTAVPLLAPQSVARKSLPEPKLIARVAPPPALRIGFSERGRWPSPGWMGVGVLALGGCALVVGVVILTLGRKPIPQEINSAVIPAVPEFHSGYVLTRRPSAPAASEGGHPPGAERPRAAPSRATASPKAEPAAPSQVKSGDPIQAVLESVAVVAVPGEGHGSGFVAAPGIVVTNYHVIEDALIQDLEVMFPDNPSVAKRRLRVELLHEDVANDLAFLAVDADVQPLRMSQDYRHTNGQRIVAVGSPGTGDDELPTLENLTTDGRLGPELRLDDGTSRWALSMAVNGGNSGGPVVDAATGEVIAVIVAKFTQTEAQSLAIPHPTLVRELAKARAAPPERRTAAASLHRQRYCLRRMAKLLVVTSVSFDRSVEAARMQVSEGGEAMDKAFNNCKSAHGEIFAEEFAHFATTVGAEVDLLQSDPLCEPAIRRGLVKLRSDIEKQADDIRTRVPDEEIEAFLARFRASLQGSVAVIKSLSGRLALRNPIEDE